MVLRGSAPTTYGGQNKSFGFVAVFRTRNEVGIDENISVGCKGKLNRNLPPKPDIMLYCALQKCTQRRNNFLDLCVIQILMIIGMQIGQQILRI